ncbi:hypothetical protein [Nocardioides sp. InS609-2]|uniref:hypothetical protein n=1 Tax=Nocardioides sp. InS609-2 TaxID=2760705 RepID=UPI0017FDD7AE|nr:hypothetical protein [Nocardioides sp. InS609-2]MBA3783837.1 hypothetical protein [Nocardioides sp.]
MSWLALLLVGLGLTDLIFSVRPQKFAPEGVAAIVVVLLGLSVGLTDVADVVALILIAAAVVLWGWAVTRGFGRGPSWWPLAVFAGEVTVAVAASGEAGASSGWLETWLADSPIPLLGDLTPDRALLLLGLTLLQLSTGNVIVRLVLAATHTLNSRKGGTSHDLPVPQLKGGRLLGPLERLFILGLGLAGQVTAAGIVVAAKGLIRFPELQAARDAAREGKAPHGPGIHEVTEYFLVGSFVSWTIALASLALLAT